MVVKCLAYLVILWSSFTYNGTRGVQISREERLDWKKQFKLLKKPSIKTIKTAYGDIYDCVDFYKQPAFDHPQLRNHTFHPQMRPTGFPIKKMKVKTLKENDIPIDNLKLNDGGCPTGSVPIKRVDEDDYIRIKQFTKEYASNIKSNGLRPQPGTNFAIVQTKANPGTVIYNGIGGALSIYNLSVGPSQYSSSEMIIQNGNDRIHVGWTVNPTLNKDTYTSLFQFLSAGDSHCFNTLCPGFVSVRSDIPIDMKITNVSTLGKEEIYIFYFIYQDPKNGNWWLALRREAIVIGFWPKQIFTGLDNSATYVAVGGETYSPPGLPLPPMGSGHFVLNTLLCANCFELFVVDENYKQMEPKETEKYMNNDRYRIYDHGHVKGWGRLLYFGGRGG